MRCTFALTVLSAVAFTAGATFNSNLLRRQSFPTCADECLVAPPNSGCSAEDDGCLCKDTAFINNATACISSSCTGSDIAEADAAARSLCLAVGVTITSASSTAPSTQSAGNSTASATSGAATTTDPSRAGTSGSSSAPPSQSTSDGIRTLPMLSAVVAAAIGAVLAF